MGKWGWVWFFGFLVLVCFFWFLGLVFGVLSNGLGFWGFWGFAFWGFWGFWVFWFLVIFWVYWSFWDDIMVILRNLLLATLFLQVLSAL